MPRKTIAEQLDRARLILTAINENADLRARLAGLGYDAAALAVGQATYNAAVAARQGSHNAHGVQLGSTLSVETTRATVERQVSALSQTARTLFTGNPEALEKLGLRMGERATPEASGEGSPRRPSDSLAALLDRARTLYNGALGDPVILAALEPVGYLQARLEDERTLVEGLELTDAAQESNKTSAQARTATQRETLERLNDWLTRLRGIAKPALRDRPDWLKQLGA